MTRNLIVDVENLLVH